MRKRIDVLRKYIDGIITDPAEFMERRGYYSHIYSVSNFCAMIAQKRNENPELAAMAGMLHDIYTYKYLDAVDHARKGAILAREILDNLKITNDEETDLICNAIAEHTDKKTAHSVFTEILVDADTIQPYFYDVTLPPQDNFRAKRLKKLKKEFGIPD